jgi:gamma-glutamylputrescine oxidase
MQYELSYWEYDTFFRRLDAVVLGSGIVGLSAAVTLKALEPTMQIAVIDRGTLPLGASTRNAGFACFGSMTELLDDLQHLPEGEVWQLVEQRWLGLQRLRSRLGDAALRYEALGGFEVFRTHEAEAFRQCVDRIGDFNRRMKPITGHPSTYRVVPAVGLGDSPYLIRNELEGQLDTGSMMRAWIKLAQENDILLLNGLTIKEVHSDGDGALLTTAAGWSIRVPLLIMATNGFSRQLMPELAVQAARNQVLITAPVPGLKLRGAYHYDRGYYYFRNVGDDRILLGGGRHLDRQGEHTDQFGTTHLIQEALLTLLREVILPGQDVPIDRWWSGILGLGPQKSPIIKRLSPGIIAAVRMGGMGVAIGTRVGEEAAALALGK